MTPPGSTGYESGVSSFRAFRGERAHSRFKEKCPSFSRSRLGAEGPAGPHRGGPAGLAGEARRPRPGGPGTGSEERKLTQRENHGTVP